MCEFRRVGALVHERAQRQEEAEKCGIDACIYIERDPGVLARLQTQPKSSVVQRYECIDTAVICGCMETKTRVESSLT